MENISTKLKRDDTLKFDFGNEKIRGVNLGGWFVLEPWITPSIFEATSDDVVDEYTFCETLGSTEAYNRLSSHWSSWIQESDMYSIAAAGMNFVRIPIGYWSVPGIDSTPYVQGAYDYLGAACDWAAGAGLKVMIDLHGGEFLSFRACGRAWLTKTMKHPARRTDSTTLVVVDRSSGFKTIPLTLHTLLLTRSETTLRHIRP